MAFSVHASLIACLLACQQSDDQLLELHEHADHHKYKCMKAVHYSKGMWLQLARQHAAHHHTEISHAILTGMLTPLQAFCKHQRSMLSTSNTSGLT